MKIPIKKYVMDDSVSWEERYRQLEEHHKEETEWLISKVKRMEPYMPAPAMGESKTDWLELAWEERDAAVGLVDKLMERLQQDIDTCLVCKDEDSPCQTCMAHTLIVGSIKGMREAADLGPAPVHDEGEWEKEAKVLREAIAKIAEVLGWEDVRQPNGDLHLPCGEDIVTVIKEKT